MYLAPFLAIAIRRTTGGFDSKNSVDSRIYEYLLPGYILAPEEPKPQRTRRSPSCLPVSFSCSRSALTSVLCVQRPKKVKPPLPRLQVS